MQTHSDNPNPNPKPLLTKAELRRLKAIVGTLDASVGRRVADAVSAADMVLLEHIVEKLENAQ